MSTSTRTPQSILASRPDPKAEKEHRHRPGGGRPVDPIPDCEPGCAPESDPDHEIDPKTEP